MHWWICASSFPDTFWRHTHCNKAAESITSSREYHSKIFGNITLLSRIPTLACKNSRFATPSSNRTFFAVYTRTTGSEYPPQQSAKQTVGFKSACSHFKHPQMWPNKLSQDKGLQICYTTSSSLHCSSSRRGRIMIWESATKKYKFSSNCRKFFPSWWSTNSCRAWVDFGFQKTKDFVQKYLSRTVGMTAKNWMLDCLCINRKGSHFICCLLQQR